MVHKKIKYPDGDFYVEVLEFTKDFTFRINSYEDLWELHQIVEVYSSKGIEPTVLIPNLFSSQADRRFNQNQNFGYKLVHNFIGSLKASIKVFHPHQDMIGLIDNVEIIDNSDFITKVLLEGLIKDCPSILKNGINNDRLILMSSDSGGFKPLMKLCDKIGWQGETYSASKSRSYADGKSKLTQLVDRQDFQGKDILIIDDISVRGGTFKGLSKLLRERNCGKLYLAVSHMTLENLGEDPVTNYFDRVFTTNSKYDNYYAPDGQGGTQPKNLEIIKMFDI